VKENDRVLCAQDRIKVEGVRDHALLLTLARTSLRVSEVRKWTTTLNMKRQHCAKR
jgi:hypothetical protein